MSLSLLKFRRDKEKEIIRKHMLRIIISLNEDFDIYLIKCFFVEFIFFYFNIKTNIKYYLSIFYLLIYNFTIFINGN